MSSSRGQCQGPRNRYQNRDFGVCIDQRIVDRAFRCAGKVDGCLVGSCVAVGRFLGINKFCPSFESRYMNSPFVAFFWYFIVGSVLNSGFYAIPTVYASSSRLPQVLHFYALFMILGNYRLIRRNAQLNVVKGGSEAQSELQAAGQTSTCKVCGVERPERAHHCSFCGRCVLKRAHHCMFSDCCIGYHNQRHFIVMVCYQVVGVIHQTWALSRTAPPLRPPLGLWSVWFYAYLLASLVSTVFIVYLFARQAASLVLGATETEMKHGIPWDSPYNRGIVAEVSAVFGRRGVLHFVWPLQGEVDTRGAYEWLRRDDPDAPSLPAKDAA